jgi:hypothetical protein
VLSTDNRSGGHRFEMDPFELLGEVSHPFGFFGIRPTLFDAPSRDSEATLEWTAHSFLTSVNSRLSDRESERIGALPAEEQPAAAMKLLKELGALLGFSWGFTLEDGRASIVPAAALDQEAWNAHLPQLAATYPEWSFTANFHR